MTENKSKVVADNKVEQKPTCKDFPAFTPTKFEVKIVHMDILAVALCW